MDYKNLFQESFEKTIGEIDSNIISQTKKSKERNRNFLTLSNELQKHLKEKEKHTHRSLVERYPDLLVVFNNRFQAYESDHLSSFFKFDFTDFSEKYSEEDLYRCAIALGAFEAYSRGENNFSNSNKFLENAYILDKNYEAYSTKFGPNHDLNPIRSDLFLKMQKERFPGYGQEPNWEEAALNNAKKEEPEEKEKPQEKEQLEQRHLKPGGALEKSEKLYVLHLLYELLSQGSEMTATEYMRILHLTIDVIDTTANISGNPPHYRKVLEGFSKDHPKNNRIDTIKSVMAKIHEYRLPMLKQILNDQLIALTKKK